MKVVKGILIVILCLMSCLFFMVDFTPGGIIMTIAAVVYFFFMPTKTPRKKREEYLKSIGAIEMFQGTHDSGLPIGAMPCTITFFADNIKIEGGGGVYNIETERLRDINMMENVQSRRAADSIRSRAVAGVNIYGRPRARIRSKVYNEVIRSVSVYVIINYLNRFNQMNSISLYIGTYPGKGMNSVMFVRSDLTRRIKKVKELITIEEYRVDL